MTEPRPAPAALSLASYTIRFSDVHVRAVPAVGLDGAAFTGPGVDLRGADATSAIAAVAPALAWLDAREPGVRVRSFSVRAAGPGGPRVLVSLEADRAEARPRALRFDPPYANELIDASRDAERVIGAACARALERRAQASRS